MSVPSLKAVGVADLLDIALVSVLIYALLVWFKRAKAAFVAKGMLVMAVVYMFSRAAGMVMTTRIFHGFFAILIIALVVIFQEELRSTFERIAVWSLSGGGIPLASPRERDILVRTLNDLARDRIGALIVLRGKDPLDRHAHGGWDLHGEISEALLKSIFDVNSIGHDGAIIVEGRSVVRFGCRLPLSKEFKATESHGTRHAAALGLAELTDALCLTVSEERGTISVARDGRIEVVTDLEELERLIEAFVKEKAPRPPEGAVRSFFRRNTREKVIAVVASALVWILFVLGGKEWRQSYVLPVQLRNSPSALRVAGVLPPQVRVTFLGQFKDFYWADDSQRLALRLDLSRTVEGVNRLTIRDENVLRPAGFVIEEFFPPQVEVSMARGATP
jgi:uncharacterized protein (TIGR00159 family)